MYAMHPNDRDWIRPHRKHCRRLNEPGRAHAMTFSCYRWQPFLSRVRSRRWMLEAIESARAAHGFHLWAYVLMPEQIHLLIWPLSPAYDIWAFLTSLKQPVAKRAVRFVRWHAPAFLGRMTDRQPNGKEAGRFWQRGGGHDRTLWEPRDVWEMIDYIHANPVRRGVCRRPEEWPWSSARADVGDRHEGPSPDRASLPSDP